MQSFDNIQIRTLIRYSWYRMDRFKELSTFVEVALRGSLSAAAREEGVTPAMIGRRIDQLEERLDVKLFKRSTRKVTLTPEGAAFLEDSQRVLSAGFQVHLPKPVQPADLANVVATLAGRAR